VLGERAFFAGSGGGVERHQRGSGRFVRERAGPTVRVEEREAHGLTCGNEAFDGSLRSTERRRAPAFRKEPGFTVPPPLR
jgi:hypothetical protein